MENSVNSMTYTYYYDNEFNSGLVMRFTRDGIAYDISFHLDKSSYKISYSKWLNDENISIWNIT